LLHGQKLIKADARVTPGTSAAVKISRPPHARVASDQTAAGGHLHFSHRRFAVKSGEARACPPPAMALAGRVPFRWLRKKPARILEKPADRFFQPSRRCRFFFSVAKKFVSRRLKIGFKCRTNFRL